MKGASNNSLSLQTLSHVLLECPVAREVWEWFVGKWRQLVPASGVVAGNLRVLLLDFFFFLGRRKLHGRITRTKRPKGPSRSSRQPGRPGLAMGATAATQRYCKCEANSACWNRALQQPAQVKSQAHTAYRQLHLKERNQAASPRPLMAASSQTLWQRTHCKHHG
jgi:hypothetical protein